jgi:triphosphoribosyl-dephospho-CoA synthetase
LSVTTTSLPAYENALKKGLSPNDAGVYSLLKLISTIDDTNIYHRGGADGAIFAKGYAAKTLSGEFDTRSIEEMDDRFIERNLSPGGAADLLAITYFLYKVKNFK